MKNVLLGGIALLLIVTAGLVVFAGDEPATDMMSLPNTTTADATKQPTLTENSTQLAMGYQDYTEAAFQESTDKRILFFHASWCP